MVNVLLFAKHLVFVFFFVRVCNNWLLPPYFWFQENRSNKEAGNCQKCDSNWKANVKIDWSRIIVEGLGTVKQNVQGKGQYGEDDYGNVFDTQSAMCHNHRIQ